MTVDVSAGTSIMAANNYDVTTRNRRITSGDEYLDDVIHAFLWESILEESTRNLVKNIQKNKKVLLVAHEALKKFLRFFKKVHQKNPILSQISMCKTKGNL